MPPTRMRGPSHRPDRFFIRPNLSSGSSPNPSKGVAGRCAAACRRDGDFTSAEGEHRRTWSQQRARPGQEASRRGAKLLSDRQAKCAIRAVARRRLRGASSPNERGVSEFQKAWKPSEPGSGRRAVDAVKWAERCHTSRKPEALLRMRKRLPRDRGGLGNRGGGGGAGRGAARDISTSLTSSWIRRKPVRDRAGASSASGKPGIDEPCRRLSSWRAARKSGRLSSNNNQQPRHSAGRRRCSAASRGATAHSSRWRGISQGQQGSSRAPQASTRRPKGGQQGGQQAGNPAR